METARANMETREIKMETGRANLACAEEKVADMIAAHSIFTPAPTAFPATSAHHPAPGAASALALGGILAMRRRRTAR